jgi:hypothetical protein
MKSTGRRRQAVLFAIGTAVAVAASTGVGHSEQERTDAQQQEILSLATIVGAALQGQLVPTSEPFGWANDFLKSSEQTTFVPFTLSVEVSKVSTTAVAMYMFVAPQGAPAAPPVPVAEPAADATAPALPEPAFEDAYHIDLGAPTEDGLFEIRRGFWVPGGDYDVYVALSESGVPDGSEAKTMMLKKALSVPNLWSDQLATSTVIQAARIESLNVPPPPDQQLANPYTLGAMRIVPKSSSEYLTSDELSLVFLVYNVGLSAAGLPDVNIDYTFNTRGPAGDEYFNRTNPQAFNQQTLPPDFDLAAGHQLVAGQAIPLSGFPAASYRLEITITDATNGASLTHNVDFSVSAS